ncbi:DNA polymerase-like protein [Tanacetum coccineum]
MKSAIDLSMLESFVNGSLMSEENTRSSVELKKCLIVVGVNTVFSCREGRGSMRATWIHQGSVDHKSVNEKSLEKDKEVLIEYIKTDILLLGGVMQKAQNIYWKLYQLDIEIKITLSSLALNIFRLRYYNDEIFPLQAP